MVYFSLFKKTVYRPRSSFEQPRDQFLFPGFLASLRRWTRQIEHFASPVEWLHWLLSLIQLELVLSLFFFLLQLIKLINLHLIKSIILLEQFMLCSGQEIVAGNDFYRGSDRLLTQVAPKSGIIVKLVISFLL